MTHQVKQTQSVGQRNSGHAGFTQCVLLLLACLLDERVILRRPLRLRKGMTVRVHAVPVRRCRHRNFAHFAHSVRLVSRSQHRANGLVCFSLRYSGMTERSTCRTSGARTGMLFRRGFVCVHGNVCHREFRFHEGQCNTRQGCAIRLFVCGDLFAHNAVAGKVIENRLVFQGGRHVRKGTCGQSS